MPGEPRTEAGRELLRYLFEPNQADDLGLGEDDPTPWATTIAAIEAEAAAIDPEGSPRPGLIDPEWLARTTRYRNDWGSMIPSPDGQWIHASVLGVATWELDPPIPTKRIAKEGTPT